MGKQEPSRILTLRDRDHICGQIKKTIAETTDPNKLEILRQIYQLIADNDTAILGKDKKEIISAVNQALKSDEPT